jgi:molecular chaperone GrpE
MKHKDPSDAKRAEPEVPHGENSGAGVAPAGEPPSSAVAGEAAPTREEYQDLIRKAEERDLFRSELVRERADFSNYQKRVLRDRPGIEAQAVRRFVIDLLPVLDNFDRALGHQDERQEDDGAAFRKGVEIIREMLLNVLTKHGFHEIDALGQPFDPFLHEAVSHEESSEFPPETVSEILEKGYTHNGLVVRAAKVKVAKAPAIAGAPPPDEEGR